jgi:F420-dependent hydroxymycolic acid dehydrogenase
VLTAQSGLGTYAGPAFNFEYFSHHHLRISASKVGCDNTSFVNFRRTSITTSADMHEEKKRKAAFDPRSSDRRLVLRSAAMLAGATALGGTAMPQSLAQGGKSGNTVGSLKGRLMGFMLPHEQFTVPELIELGVLAEQSGFDLLATSDHFQPWQANELHAGAAWITMGALAQRTKRVWIGPTVTCPTFLYNAGVVAQAFATLSSIMPGRIFLGLGSGEALNEQAAQPSWPKWPERSERLVEATDIIRKLWQGQQVDHKGKYYTLNAKLYDPPSKPIPLLMAANGPKAMRRAGQYADGLITDPKTWKEHKGEFEAGAKAAGKDIKQVPVLVELFVVVGGTTEARKAAELWRFIPKAFKTYYDVRDPQEIQKRAEAELPLEQVYADWPGSTDPQVHIKAVNELFDSGATIVNIHSGQPDQKKVIAFYSKNVLPKVRSGGTGAKSAA